MYYEGEDNFFGTGFCISVTRTSASVIFFTFYFYLENANQAGLFVIPIFFTFSHFFY